MAGRKLPLLAVEADLTEEAQRVMAQVGEPVVDERLRLVLLCAHPSLAPESAAALTLRLVLGVSTADIARLFLVSQATMAARLTRARKRLASESFTVPDRRRARGAGGDRCRRRLPRVHRGLRARVGCRRTPPELAGEADATGAGAAVGAARGVRRLDALLALMLLQHSRRDARVADGRLVLLPDQDRRAWHHDEIAEALGLLTPWLSGPSTAYLLQALIASQHAVAPRAADTDWTRIAGWYAELEELTGSPVVRLNRAVAAAESDGPHAGLRLLEGLDLPGHRLPGARAELQARAGLVDAARRSFSEAIALCDNEAERAHLLERQASL